MAGYEVLNMRGGQGRGSAGWCWADLAGGMLSNKYQQLHSTTLLFRIKTFIGGVGKETPNVLTENEILGTCGPVPSPYPPYYGTSLKIGWALVLLCPPCFHTKHYSRRPSWNS